LGHSDGITVGEFVTFNVSSEPRERNAADDGLVRFSGAMSPSVIVVKAAENRVRVIRQNRVDCLPRSQHLNQMLLSRSGLLALAQT
jgi:hypothetical protein